MRKVLLVAVLGLLAVVPSAGATGSRSAIQKEAVVQQVLNFSTGEASIEWCSRKSKRLLVCEVTNSGLPLEAIEPTEGEISCSSLLYAFTDKRGNIRVNSLGGYTCRGFGPAT